LEAFERRPEVPKDPALKQSAIYPLEKNEFLRTERKAIRFDARRGDVMYWSPSYWHCAAASPGLAVTLTMGFEQDAEGRRRFREAASSKSTREAGPQKSEVEIRLELATRCGLASSPDRASLRDLAEGESLQLTGPWPIRSSKLNARVLAVAAHGYSLRVPASFAPMIRALNTRATFRVGALLDLVEPRTGSGRNKARSALADFSSWHALHVGSARATARNTKGLTTRSQRR
jgi:hypothetical protein